MVWNIYKIFQRHQLKGRKSSTSLILNSKQEKKKKINNPVWGLLQLRYPLRKFPECVYYTTAMRWIERMCRAGPMTQPRRRILKLWCVWRCAQIHTKGSGACPPEPVYEAPVQSPFSSLPFPSLPFPSQGHFTWSGLPVCFPMSINRQWMATVVLNPQAGLHISACCILWVI